MDKKQKRQMIEMDEEELFVIDGGDGKGSFWQNACSEIIQGIINIFKP